MCVLAPHAPGVDRSWQVDGVEVRTFRYAPEALEVIGYSRSLDADERLKGGALIATPLYAAAAAAAVARLRRQRRFDLVHAHWVVPNGLIAATVAGSLPLAIGLHGSDVFLAEKPGVSVLVKAALRRTRLLTGCSPELVRRVCALGLPDERSEVIPYGVDVELFSPRPENRLLWRQRLGIPEQAPLLLAVGRMATKKGFHILVPQLGELLRACPSAHVVLAGAGDLLEELRAAAAPWAERVHFPGAVYRDTLPDLYRAADLFVLPAVHDGASNVDGLPNVILEAMASGLPVVASDLSGIPLAVQEGVTGRLLPEGDGAALLATLAELLASPETCRRLGAAGRRRAEAELTWDAVASRYRCAYQGCTTKK